VISKTLCATLIMPESNESAFSMIIIPDDNNTKDNGYLTGMVTFHFKSGRAESFYMTPQQISALLEEFDMPKIGQRVI